MTIDIEFSETRKDISEIITQTIGALVVGILVDLIYYILHQRKNKQREERTTEKIDRLSDLLRKAGSEIDDIEKEISTKSKKLEELNSLSKRLDSLVSLKGKQVEAIKQELRATIKENNRANRIWTILVGALWFVIGLVVGGFLGF